MSRHGRVIGTGPLLEAQPDPRDAPVFEAQAVGQSAPLGRHVQTRRATQRCECARDVWWWDQDVVAGLWGRPIITVEPRVFSERAVSCPAAHMVARHGPSLGWCALVRYTIRPQ